MVNPIDTKIINYLKVLSDGEKRTVLSVVKSFVKESKNEDDFWDKLSAEQQLAIDAAIKQADEGKLTSHEVIMKKLRK